MNWRNLVAALVAVALGALAWRTGRWAGLMFLAGVIVLWVLLHVTRLMTVLKRAADRPLGYVGSAVMLNSRLHRGQPLWKVIAQTRSLGELQTERDAQPEIFRWRDEGGSYVDCTFADGRLTGWQMIRPAEPEEAPAEPAPEPPATQA